MAKERLLYSDDFEEMFEEDVETYYERFLRECGEDDAYIANAMSHVYEWENEAMEAEMENFMMLIKDSDETQNSLYGYGYIIYGQTQRWNGRYETHSYKTYDTLKEAIEACLPRYEATSRFYIAENGDLCYRESSHDAPMGGTKYIIRKLSKRGADYMIDHQYEYGEDLIGKVAACRGMTKKVNLNL